MSNNFISVNLDQEQKTVILKKASFFVEDPETQEDLNNRRKRWIRFHPMMLSEVIGELCYHYNRSRSDYESMVLDELILHLENFEKKP